MGSALAEHQVLHGIGFDCKPSSVSEFIAACDDDNCRWHGPGQVSNSSLEMEKSNAKTAGNAAPAHASRVGLEAQFPHDTCVVATDVVAVAGGVTDVVTDLVTDVVAVVHFSCVHLCPNATAWQAPGFMALHFASRSQKKM